MLEASVFALQEGDGLIASLQQAMGSNPLVEAVSNLARLSLCRSVEIVELWMETIHTNRVAVTKKLQESRQSQLCHWASLIREKHEQCTNQTLNLGHSTRDVDEKLSETLQLASEAKALRRDFTGGEVLTNYENYLAERLALIQKARYVFSCAEETNRKFDNLGTVINTEPDNADDNLQANLIVTDKILSEVEEVARDIMSQNSISCDTTGLQACLQALKEKSQIIHGICDQHRANRQKRKSLKNFSSELNEVNQWLRQLSALR